MILIKAKIKLEGNKALLELPQEIIAHTSNSEAELFPLRDGFYLLSLNPLPQPTPLQHSLSDAEFCVLEKLTSLKFEERNKKAAEKALNKEELLVLDSLLKKKTISFYSSAKYPSGVYNVPKEVYSQMLDRKRKMQSGNQKEMLLPIQQKKETPPPIQQKKETLLPNGKEYAVVEEAEQEKFLNENMLSLTKAGEVFGSRGFDRKYYICTRRFYDNFLPVFSEAFKKGGKNASQLCDELKINPDSCIVMLKIMCEKGEAIEKRKGVYFGV